MTVTTTASLYLPTAWLSFASFSPSNLNLIAFCLICRLAALQIVLGDLVSPTKSQNNSLRECELLRISREECSFISWHDMWTMKYHVIINARRSWMLSQLDMLLIDLSIGGSTSLRCIFVGYRSNPLASLEKSVDASNNQNIYYNSIQWWFLQSSLLEHVSVWSFLHSTMLKTLKISDWFL